MRKSIEAERQPGWGKAVRYSLPIDQKGYEAGIFSNQKKPYVWLGPKDGPGTVLTVDVVDVKRLLKKAGVL